jgi:hypothetical protein
MHRRFVTSALATAVLLTACGGGGGSGSPEVPNDPALPSETTGQHIKVSGATEAEWDVAKPAYVACYSADGSSCLLAIIDGTDPIVGVMVGLNGFPKVGSYSGNGVDGSAATTQVSVGMSGPTWYLENEKGSFTLALTSVGAPIGDPSAGSSTYEVHGAYHAVVPASSNGATGEVVVDWTF